MLIGTHTILYSRDAEADRAFLRDILGLSHVDAGRGWLIFALPPGEVAVHPSDEETAAELYLLTDDLGAELARLAGLGVAFEPVTEARWGSVTRLTLPGGGRLGLYQPRHPLALTPLSK
jgi:catechol 2,3-dioxygenase-like lactoylglutathione lyase family enzyme